jgi:hypothetical protein
MFLLAFISLMLSYITNFMFFGTCIFFCAGFVMLSITLIKNYISQKQSFEESQDAIIMELAQGEDGEKYVMQNEKQSKKQKRSLRLKNFDRLLPSIFSILAACLFAYLIIQSIINLF